MTKKSKWYQAKHFLSILAIFLIMGCIQAQRQDTNVNVPAGDPPFPVGKVYGVIDPYHYLKQDTINECLPTIEKLRADGIVEMVILIMPGVVNDPETYATHYGRYAELGEKGKNNGLVWLVRPDVVPEDGRITNSIGRGLPRFTASDALDIMKETADGYLNIGNLGGGIVILVERTDEKMRKMYR